MEMIIFFLKSLLASKVTQLGDGRGQESLTRRAVSECLAIPAVLDAAKENLPRAAPRVLKQEHHDRGEEGEGWERGR